MDNENVIALDVVEKVFNEKHGLDSMYFLFPQTKSIIVNAMSDREAKYVSVAAVKQYCEENNIDHFYVASEAWVSRREKTDNSPIIPPSEDPNREELLIVSLISKNGDAVFCASIIGNEAPGRFLGNWKNMAEDVQKIKSIWDECLS